MRLTFLGVRGSTPAPGAQFARYGGHTACIAVSPAATAVPDLALDAGTGLRALTPLLHGAAFHGSVLLSHLHWDHAQGLPFFAAGDRPDAQVTVLVPSSLGRSGRDLVAQAMSPPAFPITPDGLQGRWDFEAIDAVPRMVAGYRVEPFEVAHKGGRTFGYRVDRDGVGLAYMPDHAPSAGVSERTLAALAGVDLLVHDAQFLASERSRAVAYGHATIDEAVALADQVGAGRLVLFHHAPHRDDAALDRIAADHGNERVLLAAEGMVLDLQHGAWGMMRP